MMRHVTVQTQGKVIILKYCLEYQKDKAKKVINLVFAITQKKLFFQKSHPIFLKPEKLLAPSQNLCLEGQKT